MNFAAFRSGGYPFFLAILEPVIRDPSDYSIAQRMLYAVAVLVLGHQLLSTYKNPVWCFLAELMLLCNPLVNRYHFAIWTESVFLSTSALFLAAALAHLRTGSAISLAAASAAAAYTLALRPTGLVFVAALAILVAAVPGLGRSMAPRLVAVLLPLAIIVGAEGFYYRAHHAGPRGSLLPTQALGKAGMFEIADWPELAATASSDSKPLQTALEFQLAPVRKLVRDAPGIAARCRLEANYETFVEYRFAPGERARLVAADSDEGVTKAAFRRLQSGITDYLSLTVDYYFCLWTLWAADDDEKAALTAYLDAHKPLPFEDEVVLATSRSPPYATAVRAGMLALCAWLAVVSVCLLRALWRRRLSSLELAVSGMCGMIVHAGLLLSALAGVGIPRYTLGLWTPLAVGIGFSVLWIGLPAESRRAIFTG